MYSNKFGLQLLSLSFFNKNASYIVLKTTTLLLRYAYYRIYLSCKIETYKTMERSIITYGYARNNQLNNESHWNEIHSIHFQCYTSRSYNQQVDQRYMQILRFGQVDKERENWLKSYFSQFNKSVRHHHKIRTKVYEV